jgi:hypothetical protein
MADESILDLTQTTTLELTDLLYAAYDVNGTPVDRSITYQSLLTNLNADLDIPSGEWNEVTDTWTRTGNHTFTISGDVTATYSKNKKIRYRDGGADEYGVILSSSESAGTTTIRLMPNSTYAMAATTITDTYLSKIENPDGWDTNFDYGVWTPTLTDLNSNTSSLTAIESQYHRVGDTVQCSGVFQADAIAATLVSFRMSLPFFTAVFDSSTTRCGGTLSDGSAVISGRIGPNTANGEADIAFVPNLTTNRTYYFTFMFKVAI